MEWVNIAVSILVGLATAIPLVVKLIEYVKLSLLQKKWPDLLGLVMRYMGEAEKLFAEGATRKEWVMAMVMATAQELDHPVDAELISDLIEELVALTKRVNVNVPE